MPHTVQRCHTVHSPLGASAEPCANCTNRYILFFVALLAGSVIWAVVQGVVCGVITTGDPHLIEHRQTMDALNFLMADMDISKDVRFKVRHIASIQCHSAPQHIPLT